MDDFILQNGRDALRGCLLEIWLSHIKNGFNSTKSSGNDAAAPRNANSDNRKL